MFTTHKLNKKKTNSQCPLSTQKSPQGGNTDLEQGNLMKPCLFREVFLLYWLPLQVKRCNWDLISNSIFDCLASHISRSFSSVSKTPSPPSLNPRGISDLRSYFYAAFLIRARISRTFLFCLVAGILRRLKMFLLYKLNCYLALRHWGLQNILSEGFTFE